MRHYLWPLSISLFLSRYVSPLPSLSTFGPKWEKEPDSSSLLSSSPLPGRLPPQRRGKADSLESLSFLLSPPSRNEWKRRRMPTAHFSVSRSFPLPLWCTSPSPPFSPFVSGGGEKKRRGLFFLYSDILPSPPPFFSGSDGAEKNRASPPSRERLLPLPHFLVWNLDERDRPAIAPLLPQRPFLLPLLTRGKKENEPREKGPQVACPPFFL